MTNVDPISESISSRAFVSYVRKDDESDHGRISALVKHIQAEFEMISGEKLEIFQDKKDIAPGESWEERILQALESGQIFIAIITPRFFQSKACIKEFLTYAKSAGRLGKDRYIIPLIYVESKVLNEEPCQDEVAATVKQFQWINWTSIRFLETNSADYRLEVHRLASRINTIAQEDTSRSTSLNRQSPDQIKTSEEFEDQDPPGILDLLSDGESAMTQLPLVMEEFQNVIERIPIETSKVLESNSISANTTFALRQKAFRQLREALAPLAENALSSSRKYLELISQINAGLVVNMQLIIDGLKQGNNAEIQATKDYLATMDSFLESAAGANTGLQEMLGGVTSIKHLSRDIRPVMRDLERATTQFMSGLDVISEWKAGLQQIRELIQALD